MPVRVRRLLWLWDSLLCVRFGATFGGIWGTGELLLSGLRRSRFRPAGAS
jgi:hypothetical protein